MSRTQGRPLSEHEIVKIVALIEKTDMSLTDIATRMDCTRSVVSKINKEFQVRVYEGRRNYWKVGAVAGSS